MKWLLILGVFTTLQAQNKQLLYGFKDIPQHILLNPGAQIDYRGFIGVPLLSQIHFNAGLTGFSAFDLFANDGKDFNQKLSAIVYNMDAKDFFGFNQQLDIFSAGFTLKTPSEKPIFISFGMYQESDAFFYFPKDYAVLAYEGNHNNLNRRFNLGDLSVNAEVLSVFHVGINKKINPKLTLGLRGKLYSSIVIDGKSYTMKTNETKSKIGLLAQDVQKAFPELVKTTNDKDKTLSVNYQGLIPVLINAIKEQQEQIDELKKLVK